MIKYRQCLPGIVFLLRDEIWIPTLSLEFDVERALGVKSCYFGCCFSVLSIWLPIPTLTPSLVPFDPYPTALLSTPALSICPGPSHFHPIPHCCLSSTPALFIRPAPPAFTHTSPLLFIHPCPLHPPGPSRIHPYITTSFHLSCLFYPPCHFHPPLPFPPLPNTPPPLSIHFSSVENKNRFGYRNRNISG